MSVSATTISGPARLLLSVVLALLVVLLPVAVVAPDAPAAGSSHGSSYGYDSPFASTTPPTTARTVGVDARFSPRTAARSSTAQTGRFLAAKARGGADEAFRYTRSEIAALIEKNGLLPGSYLTKSGKLSPLQAQIDLALPPNRGLPGALIRVDLAGLRHAGYDIGEFTKVGRKYNMPGGGTELQFEKAIPPEFVTVVRR